MNFFNQQGLNAADLNECCKEKGLGPHPFASEEFLQRGILNQSSVHALPKHFDLHAPPLAKHGTKHA